MRASDSQLCSSLCAAAVGAASLDRTELVVLIRKGRRRSFG
jgi:hypothetical protein